MLFSRHLQKFPLMHENHRFPRPLGNWFHTGSCYLPCLVLTQYRASSASAKLICIQGTLCFPQT